MIKKKIWIKEDVDLKNNKETKIETEYKYVAQNKKKNMSIYSF